MPLRSGPLPSRATIRHFSEIINAVTARCAKIRRLLQPAWDVALAWQREEPPVHHTAMPWQVLLALASVALTWGWLQVAGILALSWGSLARIGEVLAARRSDLAFPEDTGDADAQLLFSIHEPKTRFRSAAHQSAKLDQPQLLALVTLAFAGLRPGEKLWPMSGQSLRTRFYRLLSAVRITPGVAPAVRDFDFASLRSGGATWLMKATENAELVRRRRRLITTKVMEIYVQEVKASIYLPRLPQAVKAYIFELANAFPSIVQTASHWRCLAIPTSSWYMLYLRGASDR